MRYSTLLIVIAITYAFTPAELVEKYRPRTQCEIVIGVFEDQLQSCIDSIKYPLTREQLIFGDDLLCTWGFVPYMSPPANAQVSALARLRSWGFNITFANNIGIIASVPPSDNTFAWSWVVRIPGMNATLALYN